MLPFQSILCAVDFSDVSRRALRVALALAARDRSRLTVLAVNEPLLVDAAAAAYDTNYLERETRVELQKLVDAESAGGTPGQPVEIAVAVGDPSAEILQSADRLGAGLVVMGTQGLGGYRKLFFGSTAARVLKRTRVPVLAVPAADAADAPDREFKPGVVLAPIDFGDATAGDLRAAAELAHSSGARLLLLHVVASPPTRAGLAEPLAAQQRIRTAQARQRLEQLAGGVEAKTDVAVATGRPADEIAATAVERRAGLIVMGLRGAGGLLGERPGSIAYQVLCMTPVPVLALPPPEPAS